MYFSEKRRAKKREIFRVGRQKKSASDVRKPNLRKMRCTDYFSAGASAVSAHFSQAQAASPSAAFSHFSQVHSPSAHFPQHSPSHLPQHSFSHFSHCSQQAFSSVAAAFFLQLPQQPTIATAAIRTTNEKIFFITFNVLNVRTYVQRTKLDDCEKKSKFYRKFR